MSERQHGYDKAEHAQSTTHEDEAVRHRHSSTLDAPKHPIASGLLSRKADGNDVGHDAEVAVSSAANTAGAPLPGPLMRKFEASLGTDLSGVRVHTGGASVAATQAVGARAYATGNQIHFGAGQYDPSSAGGQQLIAHEVAHTVQQRGGSPSRQNKLEVSSPDDAHEHEADRAADAMVHGKQFQIGATSPMIARKPDGLLPPAVNWQKQNVAGAEITGPWQGAPVFIPRANPLPGQYGDVAEKVLGQARDRFKHDWGTMQALYNRVAEEITVHHKASDKLASVDLQPNQDRNLEANVAGTRVPGESTTVAQSFNADGSVGGKHNFDRKRVGQADTLKIDEARKEVANKTTNVNSKAEAALAKEHEMNAKGNDLATAFLDKDMISEEGDKEAAERELEAMKKSAALINDCIGAASEMSPKGGEAKPDGSSSGGSVEGISKAGLGTLKVINTLIWEAQMQKVQTQLTVISGRMTSIKKETARQKIAGATSRLRGAMSEVKIAHNDYTIAMTERTTAHSKLADLMKAAALKSGATPKQAAQIHAAVHALPAMEMLVEISTRVAAMINPPVCEGMSAGGCGQTTPETQQTMMKRNADLTVTKTNMERTAQTWKHRVNSVSSLVNNAR